MSELPLKSKYAVKKALIYLLNQDFKHEAIILGYNDIYLYVSYLMLSNG